MQPNSDHSAGLPATHAALNYVKALPEKNYTYTYEPAPGVPTTNVILDPHTVAVHDLRPLAVPPSLDREGFALTRRPSVFADFTDEDALKSIYYRECEEIVGDATGARRVVVFDHTIRRHMAGVADRAASMPRQPATRVHNDYTELSGPQRVRDVMGDEAEGLLRKRYAFINLWRPLRGPVLDTPLAMCDARSTVASDFLATDLIYRDRRGEIYTIAYNPSHRWFYAPKMEPDEALLLKCYDADRPDLARFSPHTAFVDPETPPDAPGRESIEIRTVAFFD
jgi:hypothetical protein